MANSVQLVLVLSALDKASAVINSTFGKIDSRLLKLQAQSAKVADKAMSIGQNAGAVGLATATALAVPIKAAVDFETSMLGVAKQMEGARDSAGKLTPEFYTMQAQVLELSKTLPMPAEQLAELAAAGLRMGVAKGDILDFTKTAVQMATAFDAANPEEIATQMGKIQTVFELTQKQTAGLADAINYLDDNALAKGGDIIEVMQRVGGTAKQIGLAKEQTAALASTFLSLGKSPEVAATATNALMRELAIASVQPAKFQQGLARIGLDAKKVQSDMARAPMETIQNVIAAINKLPKEAQTTVTTQLFGKEYGDDVALLAGSYGELQRQLELVNPQAAKFAGSMSREFAARMQTSGAQLELLKNEATAVAIEFGTALLPVLRDILAAIKPIIVSVGDWIKRNPELTATIGKLAAGFAAVSLAVSGVSFVFGGLAKAVNVISVLGRVASVAFRIISTGIIAVGRALLANPILLIIAGIATAAYLIYKNWGAISAFFTKVWNAVYNKFSEVIAKFKAFGGMIIDGLVGGIKAAFGNAVNAVGDLAGMISGKFKAALGIRSPSRVFVEYGRNVALGAAIGMQVATPVAAKATQGLSNTVINNAAPVSYNSASGGGGAVTVHYAPVINISGGGQQAQDSFSAQLKAHQVELLRLIEEQQRRNGRKAF